MIFIVNIAKCLLGVRNLAFMVAIATKHFVLVTRISQMVASG